MARERTVLCDVAIEPRVLTVMWPESGEYFMSYGHRADSTLSCGQRTDSTLSCGPPAKPLSCPTSQFGEVAAHVQQTEAFCQRAAVLLVQLQLPTSGLFPRFTAAVRRAVFRPAGKGRDDRQMGNVRTDTQTHRLGRSAKGG